MVLVDNVAGDNRRGYYPALSCYYVSLDYNFVPVGGFSACRNHVAPGIQSVCCVHTRHTYLQFIMLLRNKEKVKPLILIRIKIERNCRNVYIQKRGIPILSRQQISEKYEHHAQV